jgi:hypothetical protein
VPRHPAPLAGFEPAVSTVTGWRALLAALQGRIFHLQQVRAPGGSRTRSSAMARRQASRYITGAFVVTSAKPPTGVEPVRPCYQHGRLPLHHRGGGRRTAASVLARNRTWSTTFGELCASRHTPRTIHRAPGGGRTRDSGVGSRRVATTPRVPSVGPGGFEPPPHRVRAEDAAITPRSHLFAVTRRGVEPLPPD